MTTYDLQHELEQADLAMRDAAYVARLVPAIGRLMRLWFRNEVRGMDAVPAEGGALIVSNHSGGLMPMDVPILAAGFVAEFGPDRPLYVLAHDMLFTGLAEPVMRRCGFLPATRDNAALVLDSGAVTILFPGGDHDAFRPSTRANVIDFAGRTGYVRSALRSNVPIVPVVSIGGHQDQLHLWRGELIAKVLRLESLLRTKYVPISFGFPFGLTAAFPPNLPLPTKIVNQVLEPVDVVAEFGEDPDVAVVDAEVRRRMQAALDRLAAERRFPVLG
ncbi:lysophospholipid acyltransferase family protein [soil metagenome]